MKGLARRVTKLEHEVPGLPRTKPGHDKLFVFVQRYSLQDREVEEQIQSIRECERCKDKLVVVIMHFGNASRLAPAQPERSNLTFEIGEGDAIVEPKPQPQVVFSEWQRR